MFEFRAITTDEEGANFLRTCLIGVAIQNNIELHQAEGDLVLCQLREVPPVPADNLVDEDVKCAALDYLFEQACGMDHNSLADYYADGELGMCDSELIKELAKRGKEI